MTSERERERRLAEAQQRPIIFPGPPDAETEAFLASLTISSLKFLNRLYRREDVRAAGDVVGPALLREVVKMNELDRAGLLAAGWWNRHEVVVADGGEPEHAV